MDSAGGGSGDAAPRRSRTIERLPEPDPADRQRIEARQAEADEFAGLVRLIADGDDQALATLYDKAGARIYGLLLRMLRSPEEATRITQEVFIEVWRQARRYDPSHGMVFAWIVSIAHQRGIECVHAGEPQTPPELQPSPQSLSQEIDAVWGVIEQRFGSARVRAGLQALNYVQRQALLLAYFEGFSQRQLAEHLGIPLHSVRLRMLDGLVNLRRALGVADD